MDNLQKKLMDYQKVCKKISKKEKVKIENKANEKFIYETCSIEGNPLTYEEVKKFFKLKREGKSIEEIVRIMNGKTK